MAKRWNVKLYLCATHAEITEGYLARRNTGHHLMSSPRLVLYQRTVLRKFRTDISSESSLETSIPRAHYVPKVRVVTIIVAVHGVADEGLVAVPLRGRLFSIVEHYV